MKNIVLGVTGGIAAYKSAEIVSRLVKAQCEVRCVLTTNGEKFITPLTLQTMSHHFVYTDKSHCEHSAEVEHIALAQWADAFVIAPATANVIGKIANGIADDFLTTSVLATAAPVIIVPAMNDFMYMNDAVQDNIRLLKSRGYIFLSPVVGALACGTTGQGKMEEPKNIVDFVLGFQNKRQDLIGKKILITAGPTREAVDPVRFFTNHSSGKMGYCLAKVAHDRGASVTLVTGPTNLQPPERVDVISIQSAQEMFQAVTERFEQQDIVIKAAAVADYRPKTVETQKIKKKDDDWNLVLERNPDILAYLGKHKKNQLLVGFAAETNNVEENAMRKLEYKNLDLIVANNISEEHSGFGVDTNRVTMFFRNGDVRTFPLLDKMAVADHILDCILETTDNKS